MINGYLEALQKIQSKVATSTPLNTDKDDIIEQSGLLLLSKTYGEKVLDLSEALLENDNIKSEQDLENYDGLKIFMEFSQEEKECLIITLEMVLILNPFEKEKPLNIETVNLMINFLKSKIN